MRTLVLDNGAYTAKIGYSHEKVRCVVFITALYFKASKQFFYWVYNKVWVSFLSIIPNCQFRSKSLRLKTFTANQLDEIKDPSGLFYILPFQKVTFWLEIMTLLSILSNFVLFKTHLLFILGLSRKLGCATESVGSIVWKRNVQGIYYTSVIILKCSGSWWDHPC